MKKFLLSLTGFPKPCFSNKRNSRTEAACVCGSEGFVHPYRHHQYWHGGYWQPGYWSTGADQMMEVD